MKIPQKSTKGFTLIELMVVMVIIGILSTIGVYTYQSFQKKARDNKRKADLSQIQKSLEMYVLDAKAYPEGMAGSITGCGVDGLTVCPWGSAFATGATNEENVYLSALPTDMGGLKYYYEAVDTRKPEKGYRLYAYLENTQDPDLSPTGAYDVNCGKKDGVDVYCNYMVSSENVAMPVAFVPPTPIHSITPIPSMTPTPIQYSCNATAYGTGADRDCTAGSVNINTSSCSGRSGADAPNFSVTTNIPAGQKNITLASISGLAVCDEILIINLQGTATNYSSVGQYETKRIASINGNVITVDTNLANTYDGTTQKIMVQRIPNYTNVTVSGQMTANAWDGTKGGVLAFRANGSISVSGAITMDGKGYRCNDSNVKGGESFCGVHGGGDFNCIESSCSPANSSDMKGICGGGGSQSANNGSGGVGSVVGGAGGAGGNGGGAGGGYGTPGFGGVDYKGSAVSVGKGQDGGENYSGNAGISNTATYGGGAGGGGTYGNKELTVLFLGSGGGHTSNGCGHAGGIIFLAGNTINLSGKIQTNGLASSNPTSRSGGSSGGSIKLFGNIIDTGNNNILVDGGKGMTISKENDLPIGGGGKGGYGRISIEYDTALRGSIYGGFDESIVGKILNITFHTDE